MINSKKGPLHSGIKIIKGTKYILRTDLMGIKRSDELKAPENWDKVEELLKTKVEKIEDLPKLMNSIYE